MDFDREGSVESDAGETSVVKKKYPWDPVARQESVGEPAGRTEGDDSPVVASSASTPVVINDRTRTNQRSPTALTKEETDRLVKALGRIKNWLAKPTCKTVSVPSDLRDYIRKLFARNSTWMIKLEGEKMLERFRDLHVISSEQFEMYRSEGVKTSPSDDFLEYLFRRGMRALLNFTMVLYEEEKIDAVIKIVDHIYDRRYIPNETTTPEQRMAYLPESQVTTINVKVKKGHYQGDSRTYEMSARPRGYVLVINNEEFSMSGGTYKDRAGTHVDGDNLCSLFIQLGFEIFRGKQHWNLKKREMVKLVRDFARSPIHKPTNAVVVVILSHGTTNGRISGVDGEHILDREITDQFAPNDCPDLASKPKIFLFVACRGSERDLGMIMRPSSFADLNQTAPNSHLLASSQSSPNTSVVVSDASDRVSAMTRDETVEGDSRDEATGQNERFYPTKIPSHSDFIVVHSTVPDHQSLRHVKDGTFFVQEFVKVLCEEAGTYDFLSMLTVVNNRVSEITHQGEKQTPELRSTLRKRLFFNPGY